MKTLLAAFLHYLAQLRQKLTRGWSHFWFTPSAPTTLATIRIACGLILLYVHVTTYHQLLNFVGPDAWVDDTAVAQIKEHPNNIARSLEGRQLEPDLDKNDIIERNRWYRLTIWEYVRDPLWIRVIHAGFILAMLCFTVGLGTRVATVLAWYGHLSYIQRGYTIWFGMDSMILFITFYLMFAPCGWALSFDRLIARYRAIRRSGRGKEALGDAPPLPMHWSATTLTRMIQIHMGIVYLCSGLAKLQGQTWWNGYATWMTMQTSEFALVDMRWLGHLPFWLWNGVSTLTTYATLAFEIGFIFLIWYPFWRPIFLFGAVALHAGIGFFMGLVSFGLIMLTGCMSYISPAGMEWFLAALFGGPRNLLFRFSRHDAAGLQQATLLKTLDVWNRIVFVDAADAGHGGALEVPSSGKTYRGKGILIGGFARLPSLWLTLPVALVAFPGGGAATTNARPTSRLMGQEQTAKK